MKKIPVFIIAWIMCLKVSFCQYFSVLEPNPSSFPRVKAKFLVFDANYNVATNFNLSDFAIKENGDLRPIVNIQCPQIKPPIPISSVLVMDVSGSMNYPVPRNIDLAKEAGNAWIMALPNNGPWECAITAFDSRNYLLKDFTNDKNALLNSIQQLLPNGGTNYDAAFIDLSAGAIPIGKNGKYKRVIVFLSDGQPNFEPQTARIIQEAKNLNISIYSVILRMSAPQLIKDICEQTGGAWFENISSVDEAKSIYLTILQIAQGKLQPCEIEWLGDTSCATNRNVEITYLPANVTATLKYNAPLDVLSNLEIVPNQIVFGHIVPPGIKDTTVQIIARDGYINVQQIQISHPRFSIQDYGGAPPPFKLSKGENRTLTIRYTAPDSGFVTAWLKITSDACVSSTGYLAAGFEDKIPDRSLRLVHPNGGEEFLVGTDTVFIWEGVLPSDTVILEYSIDAGATWNLISDKATGLRYVWKGVPNTPSRRCLGRVRLRFDPAMTRRKWYFGRGKEGLVFENDTVFQVFDKNPYVGQESIVNVCDYKSGDLLFYAGGIPPGLATVVNRQHTIMENGTGLFAHWDGSQNIQCCLVPGSTKKYYLITNMGWDNEGGSLYYSIVSFENKIEGVVTKKNELVKADNYGQAMILIPKANSRDFWLITNLFRLPIYDVFLVDSGGIHFHKRFTFRTAGNPYAFAYHNKTKKLALSGWRGLGLVLFDFDPRMGEINNERQLVNDVAMLGDFSPDGSKLYYTNSWNALFQFDLDSNRSVEVYSGSFAHDTKTIPGGKMLHIKDYSVVPNPIAIINFPDETAKNNKCGYDPKGLGFNFSGELRRFPTFVVLPDDISGISQSEISDTLWSIIAPKIHLDDVDIGTVCIGSFKDTVLMSYIENTLNFPLNIDSIKIIGVNANEFYFVSGFTPSSFVLSPGEKRALEIGFHPTAEGYREANLNIYIGNYVITKKLTGFGAARSIDIIVKNIVFADVRVGRSKDTTVTVVIVNRGPAPILVLQVVLIGPDKSSFTIVSGGGSFTLNPGEERAITIRFSPKDVGRAQCYLEFVTVNDCQNPIVELFGNGKCSPMISASPPPTLNLVCETNQTASVIILNPGCDTLNIIKAEFNGDDAEAFSFVPVFQPLNIEPDSSATLYFEFKPKRAGVHKASLVLYSDADPDSIMTIPLIGKKEINFAVSPDTIDLGYLCPNEVKDTLIEITNISTIPIEINIQVGNNLQLNSNKLSIDTNQRKTVSVRFNGLTTEGEFLEKVTLRDTVCNTEHTIFIKGEVSQPIITSDNMVITAVAGTYQESKLKIQNIGKRPVEIISISGIDQPFELVGASLPIQLNIGEEIRLTVRYTANDTQSDTIQLRIVFNPCNQVNSALIIGLPLLVSAELKTIELSGYPGDIVKVPVILSSEENLSLSSVNSFDVDLMFNPTLLYTKGYTIQTIDERTAKITIKSLPANKRKGETLAEIEFIVGLGNAEGCDLILSNAKAIGGEAEIALINGEFKLLGVCKEGGARLVNPLSRAGILNIVPNPADGSFEVEVSLNESGWTELGLYNILGEKVKEIISQIPNEQGVYRFRVEAGSLARGVFILQLHTPTVVDSKLLFIK